MTFSARCRPLALLLTASLLVLAAALLFGACSNNQNLSESTVSPITTAVQVTDSTDASTSSTIATGSSAIQPADTTTARAASSTTVGSGATTTAGQTTTSGAAPTTTAGQATTTTSKPTPTTAKGPVVLKISGPAGTKELSMADLQAMSAASGYGGWKNDLNNITGPVSWKGVSLKSLMQLVGGGSSVAVIASDGYAQTLSSGEVAGQLTMFDPATGETISSVSGSLRAIVAYAKEGAALSSSEGPLRLAFVSSAKDQVTPSKLWVRMVVELRIQ